MLAELHDEDLPSPFGPIANPVDRFAHLPRHVRAFLESLDEEDIANARTILKSFERMSVIGWALKWLGIFMAGSFTATITLGEGLKKAYGWFLGS